MKQSNCAAVVLVVAAWGSHAIPLNPLDFVSLGALPSGGFSVNTDTLTYDGAGVGVTVAQAGLAPEIAVFTFDGGSRLDAGASISVTGSRPLALLFRGAADIRGNIDVSAGDGGNGPPANLTSDPPASPGVAGPGGYAGGIGFDFGQANSAGNGAGPGGGGGGGSSFDRGTSAGGGGHGTPGQTLTTSTGNPFGGPAYGDLFQVLRGGSGGGGGGGYCCPGPSGVTGGGGGGGGGVIELGALTDLFLIGATILAEGGDGGAGSGDDDGGGGAGGGIFLHAFNVSLDADTLLSVDGGIGGAALEGGCGGAGRIGIMTNSAGALADNAQVFARAGGGRDPECSAIAAVALAAADDIGTMPSAPATTTVPEPATWLLTGLGVIALVVVRFTSSISGLHRRRAADSFKKHFRQYRTQKRSSDDHAPLRTQPHCAAYAAHDVPHSGTLRALC